MREVTTTTTVYSYKELSDTAKEKARDYWRKDALYDSWWEGVYEWADEVFKILGITSDDYVKCMDGKMRRKGPDIRFSGFSSQGDGACFEGSYSYAKGSGKAIRKQYPREAELHRIVDALTAAQMRNGYKLSATLDHAGRYCHEHTVFIKVYKDDYEIEGEVADDLADTLRDLMRWVYKKLEAEHDYLLSDECIEESILCSELEFTEDGNTY